MEVVIANDAEDVAYALAFSENLYELGELDMSDKLRRAALTSRVDVLLGSRYLVAHLDAALRIIVARRFVNALRWG